MAQILQVPMTSLFGKLLFPLHFFATLTPPFVFCCYVIIRHRNQMSTASLLMVLWWQCTAGFGLGLILTVGGYLLSHGIKNFGFKVKIFIAIKERQKGNCKVCEVL